MASDNSSVSNLSETCVHTRALLAAAHLAHFIRLQIKNHIGLTSSAGISRNKLLSKLVANVKKPDGQTVFLADPRPLQGNVQSEDATVQRFLDPLPIRKIYGFGSKVVGVIQYHLENQQHQETVARSPPDSETLPLTVSVVRKILDRTTFVDILSKSPVSRSRSVLNGSTTLVSSTQANRLWDLLHGHDTDPVKPTPAFPKQISVEDSFAKTIRRSFQVIRREMKVLVESLLTRLEEELMHGEEGGHVGSLKPGPSGAHGDEDAQRTSGRSSQTTNNLVWKRYPRLFRLTLRLSFYDTPDPKSTSFSGRVGSQSVAMPSFIFDTTTRSISERADLLMHRVGERVLRDLLGLRRVMEDTTTDDDRIFEIYV